MAGNLTYQAELVDKISPALTKIQDNVKKTADTFSRLQTALAGLAVGGFVVGSIRMAAALDDVATASGIALDKVIGFGKAVAANGGSIDGANTGIARFANFIESAASGSAEAQNKFAELGITFKDLKTLSEADLLRKTIDGLSKMEDNAKRTALGMQIFGKSFNSVDFRGVNDGLDQFIAKSGVNASAVKAAADAEQAFANAIGVLQIKVLAALDPVSKLATNILDASTAVGKFIDATIDIALVIASLFAIGKAAQLVRAGFILITDAGAAVVSSVGSIIQTVKIFFDQMSRMTAAGQVTSATLTGLATRWKYLKEATLELVPALATLGTAFYAAYRYAKDFFGLGDKVPQISDKDKAENEAEIKRLQARADAQKEQFNRVVTINAEVAKEKKFATDALNAYQQQNKELNAKFALQTRTMGMSEEQKLVEEENASAQERYLKAIEPLQLRINDIKAKGNLATQSELDSIPELQAGINKITQEHTKQEPIRTKLLKDRIDELLKTKEMAYQAELLTKAEERRLAVSDQLRETLLRGPEEARKAYEEMQLSGMTGVARKLKEIEIEENRLKKASLERIAAQFSNADGEMVDAAGFARAVNEIEAATKRNIGIRQAAARNIGAEQRTFADGWKKAFAEYRDSATNAANQAGKVFAKFTQGLEDGIVNFVKTGKFEWKSFTASILEELLRGQIQKGIASILGPLSELMGIDLGSIAGGNPGGSPTNPMWTKEVGGNNSIGGGYGNMAGSGSTTGGSGIGSTIESIFSGVKDAASSVWDGITGAFGGITDAIGSIFSGGGGGFFSGLSDLFGGFFANGGTLGAGKFGIAGENGPELISGPASIAPMGGQTNVTYNINAVDAASFKAMIAADPGFIHAVAMQGGKSMPRRY